MLNEFAKDESRSMINILVLFMDIFGELPLYMEAPPLCIRSMVFVAYHEY